MSLIVFVGLVVFAADKPVALDEAKAVAVYDGLDDEWKEKAITAWKERQEQTVKELADLQKEKLKPTKYKSLPQLRAEQNKRIERQVQRVNAIRKNDPPYFPPIADQTNFKPGDWGVLGNGVVSAHRYQTRVVQILTDNRMLCELGINGTFIIEGVSTKALADDRTVQIAEPLYVVGNESYTTVAGAKRTVFLLRTLPKAKQR